MFTLPANAHSIKTNFNAPTHHYTPTFGDLYFYAHTYTHRHSNNQSNTNCDLYPDLYEYFYGNKNSFPDPHTNPFSSRVIIAPG
jgi:hypothetical protein